MCHFYSLVYIPAEVVSDANALRFQQWSADTDFLTKTCSLQAHPTAQIYFSKMRECGSEAGENKIQSDSFITHSVFMWLCFYSIIVFTLKYNVPTPVGPTCCCGRWDGGAGCIRILWQGTWLKKHPLFSSVVARVKVLAQRNSTKQWILYMFNLLRAPVPLWSSDRLTPNNSSVVSPKKAACCLWRHSHEMLPASSVLPSLDGWASSTVVRWSQRWNHHQSYQFWLSLFKIFKYQVFFPGWGLVS